MLEGPNAGEALDEVTADGGSDRNGRSRGDGEDAGDGGERFAETVRLIDAALVLSADHELNTSAFTARCVAAARAPLAAMIGAAPSAPLLAEAGGGCIVHL